MKIRFALILIASLSAQYSFAQDRIESEELHCARTISSISAILIQLKSNPAIRNEQIAAVIEGHTTEPGLRVFIRTEIVPRIFSQDNRSTETYLSSRPLQEKCLQALNTYLGPQGK